jgi:hypothetical protein
VSGTAPGPRPDGLEPVVVALQTEPAGRALASLRRAQARLVVTVDGHGCPRTVVPARTLAAAGPAQEVASCGPAWPAETFTESQDAAFLANPGSDRRVPGLARSAGRRVVVVRGGQIAGVVPVPALIDRPGRISRLLETLLMGTGQVLLRLRYGRRR